MGSAIIPLSLDDEVLSQRGASMACMAVPWLFSVGYVLSFTALFSKTWRINKVRCEQASKIFQGVQAVLATFGGIALLVSAIGSFFRKLRKSFLSSEFCK